VGVVPGEGLELGEPRGGIPVGKWNVELYVQVCRVTIKKKRGKALWA